MSECRALTNFIGNAVATIVVAKWQNALDTGRLNAALSGQPAPPVGHPRPTDGPGTAEVVRFD